MTTEEVLQQCQVEGTTVKLPASVSAASGEKKSNSKPAAKKS